MKHGMKKQGEKSFFYSCKAASVGVTVDETMLAKINRFALKDLTAEEIFVRKQLLAHNGVDRDRERFPEQILDDFAKTLPGKNVLYFHDKNSFLPLGLYFDAATETMSAEQFQALTGDDPGLPEGIEQVKVVWAWYYAIKTPDIESVLANIEGGVYRHWSLGFGAADLMPVKKEVNGPTLYWEYVAPGEAREGSLVWLGAQQGATSQKSAGRDPAQHTEGVSDMKKILILVGGLLGKSFADDTTDEALADAVKKALGDKDTEIKALKEAKAVLEPLAADGKAFRETLVGDYVRMKAALGEAETDASKQEGIKAFASSMAVDMLKAEVTHLEKRMAEKFPDGQLAAGDPNANRKESADDDNPLIVKDDK